MASRGYDRSATNRCLADSARADLLAKGTRDAASLGLQATPSFAIGGVLLDATHDWATLRPQLDSRLNPK
jgi:protein-disulfide isomerase